MKLFQIFMFALFIAFLASVTPLLEFRFGIPIGVGLGANVWVSGFISFLGGVCAFFIARFLIPKIITFARKKSGWLDRFITKFLHKTQKEHSERFKIFSEVALAFFVFLPIPGSGVYTAALLEYIFRLPKKKSALAIITGVFFGSILVALITKFGFGFWNHYFG